MNKPESHIPDELLSAYLDGELSAAEQRQVTDALEEDPRLQTLLDELRQVRDDVKQLPQHSVPPEFAERILQTCCQQSASGIHRKTSFLARKRVAGVLAVAASLAIIVWAANFRRPGGRAVELATNKLAPNNEPLLEATDDLEAMEADSLQQAEKDRASGLDVVMPDGKRATARWSAEQRSEDQPGASGGQLRDERVGGTARNEFDATIELTLAAADLEQLKRNVANRSAHTLSFSNGNSAVELADDPASVGNESPHFYYAPADDDKQSEAAELLVAEGTPQQITAAIQNLKAVSTKIVMLQEGLRPEQFGMKVASMDRELRAARGRRRHSVLSCRRSNRIRSFRTVAGNATTKLGGIVRASVAPDEPKREAGCGLRRRYGVSR